MAQAQAKTNWNFYLILIAIATIGLGYWLVILPQLQAIEDTNNTIKAKTQELEAAQKRRTLVEQARNLITKQPNDFRLITLALPTDSEVGGTLVTLESLAAKHGVSIKGIEPAVADAATGVLPVTMKIQSEYKNLIDFMNGLQSNLRPIKIKSATALKQLEGSTLDVTLVLNFIFVPKPPTSITDGVAGGSDQSATGSGRQP